MQTQRYREDRPYSNEERSGRGNREWREGRNPSPNMQEGRGWNTDDEEPGGGRYGGEAYGMDRGPERWGTDRYGQERFGGWERGGEGYWAEPTDRGSDSYSYMNERSIMDEPRSANYRRGPMGWYGRGGGMEYGRGGQGWGGPGAGGGRWHGGEGGLRGAENTGWRGTENTGWRGMENTGWRGTENTGWRGTEGGWRGAEGGWRGEGGSGEGQTGWGGGYQGSQRRREFIGKGPKGYSRSDDRIREEVCERLSDGYLDASEMEVTVNNGQVTLSGTVQDRKSKRWAEELAEYAAGVRDVENKLKVKSAEYRAQTTSNHGAPSGVGEGSRSSRESGSTRRSTASA